MAYEKTNPEIITHFVKTDMGNEYIEEIIEIKGANAGTIKDAGYTTEVTGPFEEPQRVNEKQKQLTRNIPENDFPEEFENVCLLRYMIHPGNSKMRRENLTDYLVNYLRMPREKLKRKRRVIKAAENKKDLILANGKESLDNLARKYEMIYVAGSPNQNMEWFKFKTEGCLGEFHLYEVSITSDMNLFIQFPYVGIKLFGNEEVVDRIFLESEIQKIEDNFSYLFSATGGIDHTRKRGLAYNIDLNEAQSIGDLIHGDNVII